MNREIKFRAWDIEHSQFLPADSYAIISTDFNAFGIMIKDWDNYREGEYLYPNSQILSQYTGLKDKNGKEIFEGDIVVKPNYIWYDKGVLNYVGVVEFIYCQWQVVAHCVNPLKHGISNGINSSLNDEGYEENELSDWEIIGNIYQNPELLNK